MGKTKTAGVRHPVLESYGTIRPADLLCSKCGEVVYHGSKKKDSADATLPKSIYACRCAYFSSSQLVLPLRQEEWEREVRRVRGDGAVVQQGSTEAAVDPQEGSQLNLLFANEAGKVLQIHRELMGMGKTMIERMIEAGEILTRVKEGLPHGAWMSWVQMHIAELSHRTINRYMRTYARRSDPLLQDDPVRFIAEISGNLSKLESPDLTVSSETGFPPNSTSTSNLETKPEPSTTEANISKKNIDEINRLHRELCAEQERRQNLTPKVKELSKSEKLSDEERKEIS